MNINSVSSYNIFDRNYKNSKKIKLISNFAFEEYNNFVMKNSSINQNIFDEFIKFEKPNINPIDTQTYKQKPKSNILQNILQANDIKNDSIEKYANQLYDEVFEIVKKQNPLFEELNIPKPELKLVSSLKNSNAGYSFQSNKIELNEKTLKDDYYICYVLSNSQDRVPVNICSQDNAEKFKSDFDIKNTDYIGKETVKLTEQEKNLWIKSNIAHELRHCLQAHIEASVGEPNKFLEYEKKLAEDIIQQKQTLADLLKQSLDICSNDEYNSYKAKYDKELEDIEKAKKEYSYILNFKPKKILDKKTELKFSLYPDDNRYWSVENHLIQSSLKYTNSDDKIYYASPTEIDAYNYQMEFIFKESNKKEYRKDCILAMGMALTNSYKDGLNNLKKNGYPELINKN